MNTVRFVKSFSKGQITIPKEVREALGIVDEFWLKLYIQNGRIIAEPIEDEAKVNKEEYLKKIMSIKRSWDLTNEIKRNREQVEKRLKKNAL